MVRICKFFPDEFPESWASDWGEDEHGIFMGFTYKGVRQLFRWIEPGSFIVGSPENEPERESNGADETQKEVTFSRGFWIADVPVTQALWEAVIGNNPSRFPAPDRPVENIHWDDAQAFISRMNEMKPELTLCLPLEAQWEYACRAGTTSPFYFGDQITSILANFDGSNPYNGGEVTEFRQQTLKVKSFPPNAWGLYEMHGNVWEWCQDEYGLNIPGEDPSIVRRVLKGGSWLSNGSDCRSAHRSRIVQTHRHSTYGFRLALTAEKLLIEEKWLTDVQNVKVDASLFSSDHVKKEMNPYRKLMVLGLNELLMRGLLSLDWDGETSEKTAYIETNIAGYNSIIAWTGIGYGEMRISVWWKYDHNKHPQANLSGNARESFSTSRPLAKKQHYPKFVGVVCSAWLERKRGKYLQGKGNDYLFDKYTRSGELEHLKQLPNPVPLGYEPEGNFHM